MRGLGVVHVALLTACIVLAGCVRTAGVRQDAVHPAWPDTYTSRVQALAVLQTLNVELLSKPSATLTLDRWCATHRLAPAGTKIVAERVRGQDKAPDAGIRALLSVSSDKLVAYRRVRLKCGDRVLSEADNWYVPSRLAPGMAVQLDSTDIPFGRVIAPLGFTRTTLSAELLWHPLPEGWEMGAVGPVSSKDSRASLEMPPFLLEHRAVLKRKDGTPISVLVETYSREVMAFPAPQ